MKTSDVLREAARRLVVGRPSADQDLPLNEIHLLIMSWLLKFEGIAYTAGWLMYRADQLDGL